MSCGRDRVAKLWDQTGKQLRAFEAFSDLALRVAVDHTCKRVIAGDWNGEVRMWNAADGKRLAALPLNPVSLIERSKEAETALAAIKTGHSKLAAEQTRLLTAAGKLQAELETTTAAA